MDRTLRFKITDLQSSTSNVPFLKRSPFQCSEPPEVSKRGGEDPDKEQHLQITRPARFAYGYGPCINEHRFEVKDDEEHGYEVKFYVETHPGRAGGHNPGFVRLGCLLFTVTFSENV